jgi:hypothetical protein
MIYRILINEHYWVWDGEKKEEVLKYGNKLKGARYGLSDLMWELHLPAPELNNPRTRFYFTELGWRKIGRLLVREAKKRGYMLKVIRRKNPRRSQIVYRDKLQMAILPNKRKKDS